MISPYLTTAEAADVLRFTGSDAQRSFLRYAKSHAIPLLRRGRVVLVLKSDVVASLVTARRSRRAGAGTLGRSPELRPCASVLPDGSARRDM